MGLPDFVVHVNIIFSYLLYLGSIGKTIRIRSVDR